MFWNKKETVYPTWRYHKSKGPVVVDNSEADQALGSGWSDCPNGANETPAESLMPASADSFKAEPKDAAPHEDPNEGAKIKTELKPVNSKNQEIEKYAKYSEDALVALILEKGLSELKESTLKRKTKKELLAIVEGK